MIKKTFYTILIILLGSIVYLNYFGVSTKKFNQNIEKKFKENYPGINLKLNAQIWAVKLNGNPPKIFDRINSESKKKKLKLKLLR